MFHHNWGKSACNLLPQESFTVAEQYLTYKIATRNRKNAAAALWCATKYLKSYRNIFAANAGAPAPAGFSIPSMTGFDQTVRLPDRQGVPSERWCAQERKTIVNVKKAEIEDLAFRFRDEVKAEILQHRGSNAVGVVGSFVVNIEAHRARYAKKLDAIRAGADATTVFLADEVGREIDALATKEIKRVRDAGRVEFEPGAADHQIPLEIHKIGLSDNQLEVIMRTAEPLAEEKCQEFLQRVAAILPMRGQISDDVVSVAVHRALSDIIRNSAVWKEWNQNSPPTLQDGQVSDAA